MMSHLSMTLVADRDYRGTISRDGVEKNKSGNLILSSNTEKSYADRAVYPA